MSKIKDILRSGRAPGVVTSTRGTMLEGIDQRFANTAVNKAKFKILKEKGKRALEKTYMKPRMRHKPI